VRVETKTASRVELAGHFEAVELSGLQTMNKDVPHEAAPVLDPDDVGRFAARIVKKQQKDLLCRARVESEVYPLRSKGRSQRIVSPRGYLVTGALRQWNVHCSSLGLQALNLASS
jgi:hypothetical protein